jgi:hypothetical protein
MVEQKEAAVVMQSFLPVLPIRLDFCLSICNVTLLNVHLLIFQGLRGTIGKALHTCIYGDIANVSQVVAVAKDCDRTTESTGYEAVEALH